jgi:hypothetical protein
MILIVLISQLHGQANEEKILMEIAGRKRHDAGAGSRKFSAKTSLKSQVISSGIYGGQTGTGTHFPLSITALPSQYYSTSTPHSFM